VPQGFAIHAWPTLVIVIVIVIVAESFTFVAKLCYK
jgi:hypothetical protein